MKKTLSILLAATATLIIVGSQHRPGHSMHIEIQPFAEPVHISFPSLAGQPADGFLEKIVNGLGLFK